MCFSSAQRLNGSSDLVRAIDRAIEILSSGAHDPIKTHELVKGMYSWADVAKRTERVYLDALEIEPCPIVERLRRSVSLPFAHYLLFDQIFWF